MPAAASKPPPPSGRVSALTLDQLIAACRAEAASFSRAGSGQAEQGVAIELLRRAIGVGDQQAWAAVVELYRPIVLACLRRHPSSVVAAEGEDYWVNRAFERFWAAVGADRLELFPTLGAVLKYLKLCTHSVIIDEVRARQRSRCDSLADGDDGPSGPGAEESIVARLSADELWRTIATDLRDEPERLVAYLSLVRDMKPAQVQSLHPDQFASCADVYRVKRNILERLRRNRDVLAFLS
jgi:DNA-directed RNA polymerase specialized sigma24 family protein